MQDDYESDMRKAFCMHYMKQLSNLKYFLGLDHIQKQLTVMQETLIVVKFYFTTALMNKISFKGKC